MERQSDGCQPPLYHVTLDVRYEIVSGGSVLAAGTGQTTLMGSHELVFAADLNVGQGASVDISVSWPAVLDGHVRLELVIGGRVAAVVGRWITVEIGKCQFRAPAPSLPLEHPVPRKPVTCPARLFS
jgi:hypothetical protein